jgi:hypothetical protein
VARLRVIPRNLTLTASVGGKQDHLIEQHNLKHTIVVKSLDEAVGMPIDTNDDWARRKNVNFYLVDNYEPIETI